MAELHEEGFNVADAKLLKSRRGQPTSLWQISLRNSEGRRPASEIYGIKSLFYCRLEVRKFTRSGGPIQCHRCQEFGHGSNHCHRELRCVRCGDGHPSSLCPKEASAPAKCCNCGEAHSANYRGCAKFKAERQNSYAAAAKAGKPTPAPAKTQPPKARGCPPPPPPVADAASPDSSTDSQDEDDGFETVNRRRHRLPRNPKNRGGRSPARAKDSKPPPPPAARQPERPKEPTTAPERRPRPTPRLRLEVPKPAQATTVHATTAQATTAQATTATSAPAPTTHPGHTHGHTARRPPASGTKGRNLRDPHPADDHGPYDGPTHGAPEYLHPWVSSGSSAGTPTG
ncbi:proline-rich protein HaeIII subfamily 1-like [Homalodisca vitripennis]|uniref:proline-rich protein HaeIII subfamily 1-like n=1 Tax=Homalodisca vitripennis TaxID=197043 RepID=UPI001EE9BE80|nr:proline-rich protein HaeIII subfamily 1-like [Homalodisca vitripennis]